MEVDYLLEAIGLSKSYSRKQIIQNLNITVKANDIYGFLGPNGSGKTTTIRTLLGLVRPDSGIVRINGYDISRDFKKAIAAVGAIVESPSLYSYLTGYENLMLMKNLHSSIDKNRIEQVLEMVALKDRAKDKVKTYSLGMKQRLAIAVALLNSPKLVLLDEPFNGLDPQGMRELKEIISDLSRNEGITFFISSHLLHEVEQICTRVGILNKGMLVAQGNVKELLSSDYENIEIHTTQGKPALSLLERFEYIKSAEISSNGVIVHALRGKTYEVNQYLMINNIPVSFIVPQNNSLEQLFFELTEGGEKCSA